MPADRLAHGYRWEDAQWKDEPLLANGSFGSMGGMLTSVRDLSRYVGAFLSAWPPHDGPETAPIRRASLREMQQVWRPAPASVMRDARRRRSAERRRLRLRAARRRRTAHSAASSSHTGGLPGFGSIMIWLPDYGVGIVAFGNLTYTGWTRVANAALEALVKTGGCEPRQPTPSPALTDARDKVSQLVAHWDDRLADSIAAENLFLDQTKERRRAEIEQLQRNGRARAAAESASTRRERAARTMDDELRARAAAGRDHAGADDAAEGSVFERAHRARRAAAKRDMPAMIGRCAAGLVGMLIAVAAPVAQPRVQVGYCTSFKNVAAAKAAGFDYVEVGTSEIAAMSDADFAAAVERGSARRPAGAGGEPFSAGDAQGRRDDGRCGSGAGLRPKGVRSPDATRRAAGGVRQRGRAVCPTAFRMTKPRVSWSPSASASRRRLEHAASRWRSNRCAARKPTSSTRRPKDSRLSRR